MIIYNKKSIKRIYKNGNRVSVDTGDSSGNIRATELNNGSVTDVNPITIADDAVKLYDGSLLKRIKYNLIIEGRD